MGAHSSYTQTKVLESDKANIHSIAECLEDLAKESEKAWASMAVQEGDEVVEEKAWSRKFGWLEAGSTGGWSKVGQELNSLADRAVKWLHPHDAGRTLAVVCQRAV